MKAVIFDMDGVLFDTESLGFSAWDYACKKLNIKPASKLACKTLGMNEAAVNEVFRKYYGSDFEIQKFRSLCREYTYAHFEKHGIPQKPYLEETLKRLKSGGFKIALASSTGSNGVYRNLKDAKIETFFDAVVCGDRIQNSKPAPDIYLAAAGALAVSPADCFAVEDSKNGILSAHSAGMNVIMIPDLWQGDTETHALLFAKCQDLKGAAEIMLKYT